MKGDLQQYYPYFEANQVLTNEHLNELANFLDEQIRLSRSQLTGIGVACGLTHEIIDDGTGNPIIRVYEGFGISSEGYFLCIDGEDTVSGSPPEVERTFNDYIWYRDYVDPSPDYYWYNVPPTVTDPPQPIGDVTTLRQLLTEDEKQLEILNGDGEAGDYIAIPDTSDGSFWEDMVLVLYLEQRDIANKNCVTNDCDNKGVKRYLTPKLLVMPKSTIASYDNGDCIRHITTVNYDGLVSLEPEPDPLTIKRFAIGLPNPVAIDTYAEIQTSYAAAASGFANSLRDALQDAFDKYGPFLGLTDKDLAALPNQFSSIPGSVNFPDPSGQDQLHYDFLKELAIAYNEWIRLTYDLKRDCFNTEYIFCRHLMIGTLQRSDAGFNATHYDPYRNYWLATPITPEQDKRYRECQMLFARILRMIQSYTPFVNADPFSVGTGLHLIPSKEPEYSLGESVIPHHYRISAGEELLDYWNPDLTLRQRQHYNRSFFPANYAAPDEVLAPLDYNFNKYPFFRTSNLLGWSYADVSAGFNFLRLTQMLPFEVTTVSLTNNGLNGPDIIANDEFFRCGLKNLQDQYLLLREEMTCVITSVLIHLRGLDFATELDPALNTPEDFDSNFFDALQELQASLVEKDVIQFFTDTAPSGDTWYLEFIRTYHRFSNLVTVLFAATLFFREKESFRYRDLCELPEYFLKDFDIESRNKGFQHFLMNCSFGKIITLGAIFGRQVDFLVDNHPRIFKNFVAKHPGMEHMGGVPKGGTLVLVIEDWLAGNEAILADFALPSNCCSPCADFNLSVEEQAGVIIPPIARNTYVFLRPGESKEVDVRNNDYDPLAPDHLHNNDLEIDSTLIVTPPAVAPVVGLAATPTVITNGDGNKVIEIAAGTNELTGHELEIHYVHYTLRSSNGESFDATMVVVIGNAPEPIIEANDDQYVVSACDKTELDVLRNDCYESDIPNNGPTIKANILFPNGTNSDTSSQGGRVSVITDVGGYQKIEFIPGGPGPDYFSYNLVDQGDSSIIYDNAQIEVTVLDDCCCCEDIDIYMGPDSSKGVGLFTGVNLSTKLPVVFDLIDEDGTAQGLNITEDGKYSIGVILDGKGIPISMNVNTTNGFTGVVELGYRLSIYDEGVAPGIECFGKLTLHITCPICCHETRMGDEGVVSAWSDFLLPTEVSKGSNVRLYVGGTAVPGPISIPEGNLSLSSSGGSQTDTVVFSPFPQFRTGTFSFKIAILHSSGNISRVCEVTAIISCDCSAANGEGGVDISVPETSYPSTLTTADNDVGTNLISLTPQFAEGAEVFGSFPGDTTKRDYSGLFLVHTDGKRYFTPGNEPEIANQRPATVTLHYTTDTGEKATTTVGIDYGASARFTPSQDFRDQGIMKVTEAEKANPAVVDIAQRVTTESGSLTSFLKVTVDYMNYSTPNMSKYSWNYGDTVKEDFTSKTNPSHMYIIPVWNDQGVSNVPIQFRGALTRLEIQDEEGNVIDSHTEIVNFTSMLQSYGLIKPAQPAVIGTGILTRFPGDSAYFDSGKTEIANTVDLLYGTYTGLQDPETAKTYADGSAEKTLAADYTKVLEGLKASIEGSDSREERNMYLELYALTMESLVSVTDQQTDLNPKGDLAKVYDTIKDDLATFNKEGLYDPTREGDTLKLAIDGWNLDSKKTNLNNTIGDFTKLDGI